MKTSSFFSERRTDITVFLAKYSNLRTQIALSDSPVQRKAISKLIEDYKAYNRSFFKEANPTDFLYSKIRRIANVILPISNATASTPTSESSHKLYLPLEQRISLYRTFLNKLAAIESDQNLKNERLFELYLFILKHHSILYHISFIDDPQELSIEQIVQVSAQLEKFGIELDNECFINKDLYRLTLDTQRLIAQCIFLLSPECEKKYVDVLEWARKNKYGSLKQFPVLPSQLAIVSEEFETFLSQENIQDTIFVELKEKKDENKKISITLHPNNIHMNYYQLALALRTSLSLREEKSFDKLPMLYSVYIHSLLACCNSLAPYGVLLTAIELFNTVYQRTPSTLDLLVAKLLIESVEKALNDVSIFYPGLSSFIYCLFLFSYAQLEHIKQYPAGTHSNTIKMKNGKKILANTEEIDDAIELIREPADGINSPKEFNDRHKTVFQLAEKEFNYFKTHIPGLDTELSTCANFTFETFLKLSTGIENLSDLPKYLAINLANSEALQRDMYTLQLNLNSPSVTQGSYRYP